LTTYRPPRFLNVMTGTIAVAITCLSLQHVVSAQVKEFVWREAGVAIEMPGSPQARQAASGKATSAQEFELVSAVGNTSYRVEYADPHSYPHLIANGI
jgi:hypothetical protein